MTTVAKTPTEIEAEVLARYATATGTTLLAADPRRLLLQSFVYYLSHLRSLIELADQRNLPFEADGASLLALGVFVGVAPLAGSASTTTARYTRTTSLVPLVIPAGHRITTQDGAFIWATTEVLTLAIGELTGDVTVRCTETGPESNELAADTITVLVDPLAGVTVTNTTETDGGTDAQTDDEFRPYVIAAPDGFTTCGPRTAYEWHAGQASTLVLDAAAITPSAGEVEVYLLIGRWVDGVLDLEDPGSAVALEVVALVDAALSADTVRPLTDSVSVLEGTPVSYTVEVSYYVRQEDAASVAAIQAAVEAAQDAYCDWQECALGRDVDPTELVARLYAAGARRIAVTSPTYAELDTSERALRDDYVVAPTYLGLYE